MWFSLGKHSSDLIPTGALLKYNITSMSYLRITIFLLKVYTLWKRPTLLPVLDTPSAVIPVLMGGADLMIPGGTLVSHAFCFEIDRNTSDSHPTSSTPSKD